MLSPYERSLVIGYLTNAANQIKLRNAEARALAEWLIENANHLSLDARDLKHFSDRYEVDFDGVSVRHWRACRRILHGATASIRKVKPDRLTRRLRRLSRVVELSSQDILILQLLVRYLTQPMVEDLVDTVGKASGYGYSRTLNVDSPVIPWMLGICPGAVRKRLSSNATLIRSGLVSLDNDGEASAVDRLRRLAWAADGGIDVRRLLIGKPRPTELGVVGLRPSRTKSSRPGTPVQGRSEKKRPRGKHPDLWPSRNRQDGVLQGSGETIACGTLRRGRGFATTETHRQARNGRRS